MPNITQKEELMGALLKGTKLESAVLSTLFSDSGASAAPQLNTLYVAYTTQRDAVTRWVVEMDDDLYVNHMLPPPLTTTWVRSTSG
jgi:hypothetical protein